MVLKYVLVLFLPLSILDNWVLIRAMETSLLTENNEYARDLSKALSYLYEKLFPERPSVTILQVKYNTTVVSVMEQSLQNRAIPVSNINTIKCYHNGYWRCIEMLSENDVMIIFFRNFEDIQNSIVRRNPLFLNSRARYIFIWNSIQIESNVDKLNIALRNVFDTNFFRAVVIHVQSRIVRKKPNFDIETESKIVTVMLYKPSLKLLYKKRVLLKLLHRRSDLFSEAFNIQKRLKLFGYPLRASTLHDVSPPYFALIEQNGILSYNGYVPKIYESLQTFMNCTMDIVRVHAANKYGYKYPNGTWEGVVRDLVLKEVDISYSSLALNLDRNTDAEFSDPYGIDLASILVAKGRRIPPWKALATTIYETEVLLSLIATLAILISIAKMFQVLTTKANDLSPLALNLFGVLFQVSVHHPRGNSMRIMFFAWVYFSLVMAAVYTGAIVSVFTIPVYYPDINDLDQLHNLEYTIRGHKYYQAFLNEKSDPVLWSLYNGYDVAAKYEETLPRIAKGEKVGMMSTRFIIQYYMRKMTSCSSCSEEFHMIDECLGIVMRSVGFPKGSPYVPRVSDLIRRVRESGLLYKWRAEEIREAEGEKGCNSQCESNHVISLEDLQLYFYILLLGNFIAIMSFGCEVMFFYIHVIITCC